MSRVVGAVEPTPECSISDRLMTALTAYSWPGNVRELEHIIERAMMRRPDFGNDRREVHSARRHHEAERASTAPEIS